MERGDERDERALPRSRWADQGDGAPGRRHDVDVLEHRYAGGVLEPHIAKLDVPFDRIHGPLVRIVRVFAQLGENLSDPLQAGEGLGELCADGDDLHDRSDDQTEVEGEGDEAAQRHAMGDDLAPAHHQHGHADDADHQRGQRADAGDDPHRAEHQSQEVVRAAGEDARLVLLRRVRFHHADSGEALSESSGHGRNQLAAFLEHRPKRRERPG